MNFRVLFPAIILATIPARADEFAASDAARLLKTSCAGCHQGKSAAAGLNLLQLNPAAVSTEQLPTWDRVLSRVRSSEMPPKGAPALEISRRDAFTGWIEGTLRKAACYDGVTAGRAPLRRLNR